MIIAQGKRAEVRAALGKSSSIGRIFRFRLGGVINVETEGAGITMITVAVVALIRCGAA